MRIALVQEQGFAHACNDHVRRQLQLPFEGLALRGTRRKITKEVQSAFADRDDFRMRVQCTHLGIAFIGVFDRVVRVHAGGGEQFARMLPGEGKRLR